MNRERRPQPWSRGSHIALGLTEMLVPCTAFEITGNKPNAFSGAVVALLFLDGMLRVMGDGIVGRVRRVEVRRRMTDKKYQHKGGLFNPRNWPGE